MTKLVKVIRDHHLVTWDSSFKVIFKNNICFYIEAPISDTDSPEKTWELPDILLS